MNTNRSKADHSISQINNKLITESDTDKWKNSSANDIQNLISAKKFALLQEILNGIQSVQIQEQTNKYIEKSYKQQWQNQRTLKYHLKYSYFFRQSNIYLICNIILFILKIILFWFLSVYRTFRCQQYKSGFIYFLITQILDITLKTAFTIHFKINKKQFNLFKVNSKDWIQIYGGTIFCFFYSIVGIMMYFNDIEHLYLIILDFVAIGVGYCRLEEIQSDIKAKITSSNLKNYFKLFNLIKNLLLIIHFFAILMYFSTNFTQTNFLSHIQNYQNLNWIELYIFSFYFSGTTVLTVGYGDILPKNFFEIFIVLLMQILGVLMTVFLNGEVGNILCLLRRQKQSIQNQLSILQRIKKNFSLSFSTTFKIRQFLLDNMIIDKKKLFNQQTQLLQKISQDLRDQVHFTNNINLIKNSSFITMNFSSKAQLFIAKKLIRYIYSPNQKIHMNQKLYFLKEGELVFYISPKQKSNQNLRKAVKNVNKQYQKKISSYCFGYVSLISQIFPRLKVFAKKFTTCYYIDKNDFIQAISCQKTDFQKYHELKSQYLTNKYPQVKQAQQFYSKKQHYVCNIEQTIDFYQNKKNKRKTYFRSPLISRMIVQQDAPQKLESQSFNYQYLFDQPQAITLPLTSHTHNQSSFGKNSTSIQQNDPHFLGIMNSTKLTVYRKKQQQTNKNKHLKKTRQSTLIVQPTYTMPPFQARFNFSNYYPAFNVQNVIKKINLFDRSLKTSLKSKINNLGWLLRQQNRVVYQRLDGIKIQPQQLQQ